jgi:hypothetical protein
MKALAALVLLAAAPEAPYRHLESVRLKAPIVYVGAVAEVKRVGALEGLAAPTQGRMEATVTVSKVLRAPAQAAAPASVVVRYDTRSPEPPGDGFFTLQVGDRVLVFAETFDKAYPRELLHGPPAGLSQQVANLRAALDAMDAPTLELHGLTPATRLQQVKLYEAAMAALKK